MSHPAVTVPLWRLILLQLDHDPHPDYLTPLADACEEADTWEDRIRAAGFREMARRKLWPACHHGTDGNYLYRGLNRPRPQVPPLWRWSIYTGTNHADWADRGCICPLLFHWVDSPRAKDRQNGHLQYHDLSAALLDMAETVGWLVLYPPYAIGQVGRSNCEVMVVGPTDEEVEVPAGSRWVVRNLVWHSPDPDDRRYTVERVDARGFLLRGWSSYGGAWDGFLDVEPLGYRNTL